MEHWGKEPGLGLELSDDLLLLTLRLKRDSQLL